MHRCLSYAAIAAVVACPSLVWAVDPPPPLYSSIKFCVKYVGGRDFITNATKPAVTTCATDEVLATLTSVTNKPSFRDQTYQSTVHTVIIAIHGDGRDAANPYNEIIPDIEAFKRRSTTLGNGVVLISPKFMNSEDNPSREQIRWSGEGWVQGDGGTSLDGVRNLSSFEVMDALVLRVKKLYRNMTDLVVMGHSGGGQFVNRYSIGTKIEKDPSLIVPEAPVEVRYLMANPRTYLYFDGKRYSSHGATIAEPTTVNPTCTEYNHYRYGPEAIPPNHYMSGYTSGEALLENVKSKRRFLLLASNDTAVPKDEDANGNDVDESCEKPAQGENRLQRGLNYMYHLRDKEAEANTGLCVLQNYCHDANILGSWAAVHFWKTGALNCGYYTNHDNEIMLDQSQAFSTTPTSCPEPGSGRSLPTSNP